MEGGSGGREDRMRKRWPQLTEEMEMEEPAMWREEEAGGEVLTLDSSFG